MKKFNDEYKIKAIRNPLVIWFGVFIFFCFSNTVFAQSANTGNKTDKSKLQIHGNMRDIQPQHFDNTRTSVVQFSNSLHKNVKTRSNLSHPKTQQGAFTKAEKKMIAKEVKANRKKHKTHKKISRSKRTH